MHVCVCVTVYVGGWVGRCAYVSWCVYVWRGVHVCVTVYVGGWVGVRMCVHRCVFAWVWVEVGCMCVCVRA